MRQQIECSGDQEWGESEWKATLDQQRSWISQLESDCWKLKEKLSESEGKFKEVNQQFETKKIEFEKTNTEYKKTF